MSALHMNQALKAVMHHFKALTLFHSCPRRLRSLASFHDALSTVSIPFPIIDLYDDS